MELPVNTKHVALDQNLEVFFSLSLYSTYGYADFTFMKERQIFRHK